MATKKTTQQTKKDGKEWLKSILVTAFFAIVFVCAFFWMDVEKNTPMQFVDKMLSWDIVETASQKARDVKEAITPLQKLVWGISDLSIDSSKVKDVSLLTENLSKLNELKEAYDELKDNDTIKSILGIEEDDTDEEKISNLVSTESSFIDNSIWLYNFLLDNQNSFSYSEDGSLEVDDSIKSTFNSMLLDWAMSQDKVSTAEEQYNK